VRLEIVDVAGRQVRTLVDGVRPAGSGSARWDGRDASGAPAASGVYFARLTAGRETQVRRIVLMH
jgi:flagellar hook assembly protein FlgD